MDEISNLQNEIAELKDRLHFANEKALEYKTEARQAWAMVRELRYKLEIGS